MVAEHEPVRLRALAGAHDLDLAADERVVDAVHADDAAAFEHDRVLDLGVAELAVGADRRVRARRTCRPARVPAPMIAGPRTIELSRTAPASTTTRPSTCEWSSTSPSIAWLRSCRARAGCSRSSGSFLPVSIHQPSRISWSTTWPLSMSHWIASVISSSPRARRLDRAHRVVHSRCRRCRRPTSARSDGGIGGLLDEADDVARCVERGDAELARIVDVREQDLRGRGCRAGFVELRAAVCAAPRSGRRSLQVLLEHVVAEVHDEVVVAEELARDQHAVREPERRRPGRCR